VYACLDTDFDRKAGLYSLPSRLGPANAFRLAGLFHVIAFLLFAATGFVVQLNHFYYIGLLLAGAALFYQHLIVSPNDLTRIHASFFSMNGFISVTIFLATWLSLATS
jgi:4-hydroxybenzoate polyprenyltransferase